MRKNPKKLVSLGGIISVQVSEIELLESSKATNFDLFFL